MKAVVGRLVGWWWCTTAAWGRRHGHDFSRSRTRITFSLPLPGGRILLLLLLLLLSVLFAFRSSRNRGAKTLRLVFACVVARGGRGLWYVEVRGVRVADDDDGGRWWVVV